MSYSGNFIDKSTIESENAEVQCGDQQIDFDISGSPAMTIDSSSNVGIGIDSPTEKLHIETDTAGEDVSLLIKNSATSSTSSAHLEIRTNGDGGGDGGGDPYIQLDIDGVGGYTIGIDNDDSDKFKINKGAPPLVGNTNPRIVIDSSGNVGIKKVSPGTTFDVNGVVNASGGYTETSDDRIKYNETSIDGTEALSIISQLKPEKYEKITQEPNYNINLGTWIPTDAEWNAGAKDNFSWDNEAGLIAQDVRSITELEFCVKGQEIDDKGNQTLLQVNYNDIYAYHIAATKELSTKVTTLETQVADLLARLSVLENP